MQSVKSIAVIGLGYVGLPLALLADKKGFDVKGVDINTTIIDSLSRSVPTVDDVNEKDLNESNIEFTSDISKINSCDAVIVCVPTPVNGDKSPDLTPLKKAVEGAVPHIKKGGLLVIESTVNPGVCDDVVTPIILKGGRSIGDDIYLAHCPERINPGDIKWNVSNINRVLGANSQKELELALDMYEKIVDAEIKPMQTLKEAEAVKVVENSFRDINIAFVNELAMSFHKLGINIENVIDGAATKPFAFMPHHPGAGVGGHCIPVDPYYLIEYANGFGFEHDFLRLARSINESMPQFTVDLLIESLNTKEKSLKGTKVTLLGLSYKPNVGDDRESPAYTIKKLLEEDGADITVYDPYIKEGSTADSLREAVESAEAIVIATGHKEFEDLLKDNFIPSSVVAIVDGRNMFKKNKNNFKEMGINYVGIGVS